MEHNHKIDDLNSVRREPWNKGKLIGATAATEPGLVDKNQAPDGG